VKENGIPALTITPGDWLTLDDDKLYSRLDPLLQHGRKRPSALRSIFGENEQPLGRVAINVPTLTWMLGSRYVSDSGCVTIGGLRAEKVHGIEGIFIGKACTATRDSALPLVTREGLAAWASEQARIISASKFDELPKAQCAEVVLECGGELAELPIVRWGQGVWLNTDEFRRRLTSLSELMVNFNGDFHYDEDEDEVHPHDFSSWFEIDADIIVVPERAIFLKAGRQTWPRSITGQPIPRDSNLAEEVRRLIAQVWGDGVIKDSEDRKIGTVHGTPIRREMTIFHRVLKIR